MRILIALVGLASAAIGLLQKQTDITAELSNEAIADLFRFNSDANYNGDDAANNLKTFIHSTCVDPHHEHGTCLRLENCEPLKTKLLQNPSNVAFINELRNSNMICGHEYAVVCCPLAVKRDLEILPENRNDVPGTLPSTQDGCGSTRSVRNAEYSRFGVNRPSIVGGNQSRLGAWPWMVLIGYIGNSAASPFKCGGTLITSRHVLTAAHCIKSNLAFVRLGEHNLALNNEANQIDVPVTKFLKHASYNPRDGHSDIAILLLEHNVQFSKNIKPICLPLTKELQTKSYVNNSAIVIGWGKTSEGGLSSNHLQELLINIYDNSVCKDLYQEQKKLISQQQFDNAVLCAGDLKGGKDTCQGDSGGPLMVPEQIENGQHFYLIGVVSYGIGCARPDSPGVYTRVGHFMNWIKNAVEDVNLFTAVKAEEPPTWN